MKGLFCLSFLIGLSDNGERGSYAMKEVYQKTSFVSFIVGIGTILFFVVYYFFFYDSFSQDGLVLLEIGLSGVAFLGAGIYFKKASAKLEYIQVDSELDLTNMHELNIQWVPSLFPTMYNVNADGKSLFKIEPSKRKPITRMLTFLKLFSNGFIFTVTYDVLDMEEGRLASFTSWTNGNRYVLSLYDASDKKIGYFEQRLTKSKLKNSGTLFHADHAVWRELKAKNIAGDIDVIGQEGETTATYRYGRFPYALHPAFQAEALHSHIRFGSHISKEEKLAYAMIFFFWLKE